MSNPYLEKAASIYEFWNDFSGKEHNELKARKAHLEKAIANNDTVEGLASKIKNSGTKTFRARGRAGLAGLGLGVAGLVGLNRYTEHQDRVATDNLRNMYNFQKQAGVISTAKKVVTSAPVKAAVSAAGKAGKKVGITALKTLNTAHGGKVRQFGMDTFGKHTPKFEKFIKADKATQRSYVSGPDLDKLKKLHTQQRATKLGVYGGAAGLTYQYSEGKKKAQQQALAQSYYY